MSAQTRPNSDAVENRKLSEQARSKLSVQIQAAKLRVLLDERRNLETPDWVKELARKSA